MNGRMIAACLALVCAGEAHAQPASSARVLESFARCRAVAAAQARADCFDAAARELETAVKTKEITIVDREEVRTARHSLFGFTVPRIGLFDGGDRDGNGRDGADQRDEIKEIESTIASARVVANGRVELRLAEGDAVWVTTDPMPFPPKSGEKVRIRKGALGNYFIAIEGERSVRGMRLR
jgi:hypothetical protein